MEQILRRDAVGAETVNRDEAGQQGDGEADDGEHLVAVTLVTLGAGVVDEGDGDRLD